MTLAFHEYANLFPLMTGARFDELVSDIAENGLIEPVTLLGGKILDGRNRALAASKAGIDIRTEEFSGQDPLSFVVSKNLARRQLNDSQRALVAARLANARRGRRTDLQKTSGDISLDEAATLLNAKTRTMNSARRVIRECIPAILSMVEAGQLSIAAASAVSHLSNSEQAALAAKGSSAIVAAARTRDPGRFGRNHYSKLYLIIDDICAALEAKRLDLADMAASQLRKKISEIVAASREAQ